MQPRRPLLLAGCPAHAMWGRICAPCVACTLCGQLKCSAATEALVISGGLSTCCVTRGSTGGQRCGVPDQDHERASHLLAMHGVSSRRHDSDWWGDLLFRVCLWRRPVLTGSRLRSSLVVVHDPSRVQPECLHTFCKPCIHQHFADHLTCPTCEVNLGPVATEKIRCISPERAACADTRVGCFVWLLLSFMSAHQPTAWSPPRRSDRAMQNIVDKVFPHFAKEEQAAEKSMQRAQTLAEEGGRRNEKAAAESEQKRNKVDGGVKKRKKIQEKEEQGAGKQVHTHTHCAAFYLAPGLACRTLVGPKVIESLPSAAKKLCLSLFPNSENQAEDAKMPKLDKPFLRSSIEATVKQYKNYLASKIKSEKMLEIPATEVRRTRPRRPTGPAGRRMRMPPHAFSSRW
jgi:hypothetical protein